VGACSGAAAAVTAGQVDFAVAVDTFGSVAVPAAYCGAFAFRFSHRPEHLEGVLPVSRTLDTIGLLTSSPEVLHKVRRVPACPSGKLHVRTSSTAQLIYPRIAYRLYTNPVSILSVPIQSVR
jgi:Asp-tRNA(Asn)/Glu-tRNA(Gln) amidotransferase A subunit family amidase